MAPYTGVEIDRHPPLVLLVFPLRKQRQIVRNALLFRPGEVWGLVKFSISGGTERVTLLHGLGVLRGGELVVACFPRDAGARSLPQRVGRPHGISIESDAVGDFTGACAPITEMHSERFVSLSRHNPDGTVHLAPAE